MAIACFVPSGLVEVTLVNILGWPLSSIQNIRCGTYFSFATLDPGCELRLCASLNSPWPPPCSISSAFRRGDIHLPGRSMTSMFLPVSNAQRGRMLPRGLLLFLSLQGHFIYFLFSLSVCLPVLALFRMSKFLLMWARFFHLPLPHFHCEAYPADERAPKSCAINVRGRCEFKIRKVSSDAKSPALETAAAKAPCLAEPFVSSARYGLLSRRSSRAQKLLVRKRSRHPLSQGKFPTFRELPAMDPRLKSTSA